MVEQACELRLELDVPYWTQAELWYAYVFHPTETAIETSIYRFMLIVFKLHINERHPTSRSINCQSLLIWGRQILRNGRIVDKASIHARSSQQHCGRADGRSRFHLGSYILSPKWTETAWTQQETKQILNHHDVKQSLYMKKFRRCMCHWEHKRLKSGQSDKPRAGFILKPIMGAGSTTSLSFVDRSSLLT